MTFPAAPASALSSLCAQGFSGCPKGAALFFKDRTMNLWDAAQCAAHMGISRQHFVDRVSKLPSFPRPAVDFSPRSRQWRAGDVMSWAGKRQMAAA